ncbi:MAG: DUF4197 domain-containing protein [Chitinophagaceae bacterium]|nr:DUF4197 domain-containing protein [Chitinophagaceae bacterium]
MKKILLLSLATITFMSCENMGQIINESSKVLNSLSLSEGDAANGLKQALEFGVNNGTNFLGNRDGFLKNAAYKILMPKEIQQVEAQIRKNALANNIAGPFLDKLVESMNRGAENAMAEAKPIFVNAIRSMTITDALKIVTGGNGQATEYLRRVTTAQLMQKFQPVIANSLNKININDPWTKVSTAYNMIAKKQVTTNLNQYVAENAINALFSQIRQEEDKIRTNPGARTTDLLKRVFAYADANRRK